MPGLRRCELWSDYQFAGGTVKEHVPLDHCISLVSTDRVTRDDFGEVKLSKESNVYEKLADGDVWRFLLTDGTIEEYRVWTIDDTSKASRLATLTLKSPLYELGVGKNIAILNEVTNGVVRITLEWKALTPAAIMAKLLTFMPAYWNIGTVTPTIPVNLVADGINPLAAARALVKLINQQGIDAELDYTRDAGTSKFLLHIVSAIGSAATALDVRSGKNLLDTSRKRDRERLGLEVVPTGTSTDGQKATMGQAWVEVTAKAGSTLTIQQPVTGGAIIGFNSQLNGLYLIDDAGARQLCSNTVKATQQVDVASAANFTAGRWYRLAVNSSGDELIRMRKDPAVAGQIIILPSTVLDNTTNMTLNPAMRAWSGAASSPPDSWTNAGGTLTRTTTAGLWVYGGQSCRTQGAVGLESPALSFYVPSWATHVTVSMWIYHVSGSGSESIEFRRDGVTYSTATAFTGGPFNQWQRISDTASLTGLTGAVHRWSAKFVGGGAGNNTYVDAVQVTLTNGERPFVEGSNPARLLSMANRYLTLFSDTPVAYQMSYADLHSWDPTGFPYDAVTLGQTVNARDSDLDLVASARLIERERNWKVPLASRLTVANRFDDLVTELTGINRFSG